MRHRIQDTLSYAARCSGPSLRTAWLLTAAHPREASRTDFLKILRYRTAGRGGWCHSTVTFGRVRPFNHSQRPQKDSLYSIYVCRQCEGRSLRRGQTTPGCCTIMLLLTSHSLTANFFTKHEANVVPQLPYSPDLVPADFLLFPKLKSSLKGRRFQTVEEIEENSIRDLRAIPQNTFQDAFRNWKKTLFAVYQEWRGVL